MSDDAPLQKQKPSVVSGAEGEKGMVWGGGDSNGQQALIESLICGSLLVNVCELCRVELLCEVRVTRDRHPALESVLEVHIGSSPSHT